MLITKTSRFALKGQQTNVPQTSKLVVQELIFGDQTSMTSANIIGTLPERCEALEFKVEALPEIEAQLTDHEARISDLATEGGGGETTDLTSLEFKVEALPEIEAELTYHETRITTNEARCEDLEFKTEALPEIEAQLTDHEARITTNMVMITHDAAIIAANTVAINDLEFKVDALPGIEARITETEEPPWSGKDPDLVLTAASSELIKNSVADYAGWDTRRLLEELFKQVTGKWFGEVIVSFSAPTPTPTVDWWYLSAPLQANQYFRAGVDVGLTPIASANNPQIVPSVGWPADENASAAYGGSHQNWYLQNKPRYGSTTAINPPTWVNNGLTRDASTGEITFEVKQDQGTGGAVLMGTYVSTGWSLTGAFDYGGYESGVDGQTTGMIKNNYGTETDFTGTDRISWSVSSITIKPFLQSWKKVGSADWEDIHTWNAPIQDGQYHEVTIPGSERHETYFRIWGTWDSKSGGEVNKVHVKAKNPAWDTYVFTALGDGVPTTPPPASPWGQWANNDVSDTDGTKPCPSWGAAQPNTWCEFGPFGSATSAPDLIIQYGYGSWSS